MIHKPYILTGRTVETLLKDADEIRALYDEYGVVIFPGLFTAYAPFIRYRNELCALLSWLIRRHSDEPLPDDAGERLAVLAKHKAADGKVLTDLGTQPNKLFSFNQIKYADWVRSILETLYGTEAILATPQAGDTLHFFPPGETFHRYNLPAHQDYQYLMQSPRQITFYTGLSNYKEGVGGLRFWEKSHKLGILTSTKNSNGAYEVHDSESVLSTHTACDYHWNTGDFGLFDSLLCHSSIPNTTHGAARIVQIFRYSDLNDDTARSYHFYSTAYERRGIHFTDTHPDLYIALNQG